MYKVKIALYLVMLVTFIIVRIAIQKEKAKSKIYTGIFLVGALSTIVFLIIQIFTWDICSVPEILFFATAIVIIFTFDIYESGSEIASIVCIIMTVVTFVVSMGIYCKNIKYSETPEFETKTYTIVCESEKISENQIYFQGTNEDKTQFYYHYLDGKEIITLTVDTEAMEKVIISHKEKPYLEEIIKTTYKMNYNNNPATIYTLEEPNVEIKYKLYIPEGTLEELL